VAVFAGNVPIIGKAAQGWLTQGQGGKVLAVVNHATYLLTDKEEVIWLVSGESPMHHRCVRWPVPLPRLSVDTTYIVRDRSIHLDSGKKLDLHSSQIWEAPSINLQEITGLEEFHEKLFPVVETFLSQETPRGYGLFIRSILEIAGKKIENPSLQQEDILTSTARPMVKRIAEACLSHDLSKVLKDAEPLVGLGEGLTPSGDDFLGGLFFAHFMLRYSFPNMLNLELPNLHGWMDANQSSTNLISYTLLKDNSLGHALEPLNQFGIGLLRDQPVENIISAASKLIKVGHSTGWSLLSGFVTGMLLALPY
jgi:hypothetical protein